MPRSRLDAAHRYVGWLRRRTAWIYGAAAAALALSIYLIVFHLPLYADFAALLPPDAPAVRDLHRLEARVHDKDTALVLIDAAEPATGAAATTMMAARIRALPAELVTRVEDDDAATRGFIRDHQQLFVPLADLEAARDALAGRIERAKLEANPLYVDLDDPDPAAAATDERLKELRERRREAAARLDRSSNVSADGRLHLVVVRTGFEKTDVDFHYVLAVIPRNPIFPAIHAAIAEWLVQQRHITLNWRGRKGTAGEAYAAHKAIYEAIAAHDPALAEKAMRDHLAHVASVFWEAMESDE